MVGTTINYTSHCSNTGATQQSTVSNAYLFNWSNQHAASIVISTQWNSLHGSDGLTTVVQVLMLVMCTVHVRMHLHNHKTGLIHKLCNFILILEAAREQDDIILSVTYAIQSLRLFVQITKNLSPSTKLFFLEHSFHKGVWEYSYLQKKHKYLLWPISYLFEILLQGFVWNFSFYSSLFENF